MLSIRGVSKVIGDKTILDNLNFTINKGEIFGFLGPNGAGKSTTIKLLTGLNQVTSGEICFDELKFSTNEKEIKKLTGYVPETPLLYDSLTAREYLEFIGGLYQIPPLEISDRIDRMIGLFEIEEYENSLVRTYPKGVTQKLSLASAWLIDPQFLLLDEPTTNLDPAATRRVKKMLRYTADRGVCIFLTTHILEIAEALCDRIAILDQGRMVAVGSMSELKQLSKDDSSSLEDIFLSLTGGVLYKDLFGYLDR